MTWALAQIRDRYENQVVYQYGTFGSAEAVTSEYVPVKIEYNFRSGPSGDRWVEFFWGDSERRGIAGAYVSGLAFQNSRLLRPITMKGPNPSTTGSLRV